MTTYVIPSTNTATQTVIVPPGPSPGENGGGINPNYTPMPGENGGGINPDYTPMPGENDAGLPPSSGDGGGDGGSVSDGS